jgi:hypothetical protein
MDLTHLAWMLWATIMAFGLLGIIKTWVKTALALYVDRTEATRQNWAPIEGVDHE